ncbi:unnamed protein product [Cylindrotheca closterium]|uniref:Dynamin N-terminal domain-containing protein n=1 Tax=Cylindrotheca closterium TaxID=2856 RepID=A0AAD2GAA0_9STRA|nr:unnamed protein product [Cylindrotheca closterium]
MAPPVAVAENAVTVAIIGYRGAGKTTALNAILGNNYSFISDDKPTTGINSFRVLHNNSASCSTRKDSSRKAESVCTEIRRDNKSHRILPLGHRKRVAKKVFDVRSNDPSFASMEDTPFFLVDIPGLDLSNPECQYRNYIDESFHTFDAVILVLDCLTERKPQHRMLKYIRRHLSRSKKMPLIIIGNERAAQIGDSSQLADLEVEVDEMFDIDSGDKVLQLDCIMSSFCVDMDCNGEPEGNDLEAAGDGSLSKPIFIPVKLHDAFRYRLASAKLSLLQVSKLGATILDTICQDEIGKQAWESLSKDEILDIVHSALSTPGDDYKLQETNFLKFMAHLERVLREVPRQRLEAQDVVEENDSSFFFLSSLFWPTRKVSGERKNHRDLTIEELRDVNMGLADTLSEVSSRDSILDKDRVEVSMMSSNTAYSDDTPENSSDMPILHRQMPRRWRNKRTAWMILLFVLVFLAIILTVIFVLFGFAVASLE